MSQMMHKMIEKSVEALLHALHRESERQLGRELSEVVTAHALTGAAAGVAAGWLPGAGGFAATAVAAGAIWTMYGRINAKLGIPFSENLMKSLATAVATNLASYFLSGVVMSSVFSLFPGIGSVAASGAAGVTGFALTVASAIVYFRVLAELAKLDPTFSHASGEDLKNAASRVMAQDDMKSVVDAAKSGYSSTKR
jgi:hypothetical protein